MPRQRPIPVFCVDDHDFVIEGLRARLELERDLEFVGKANSADDLLGAIGDAGAAIVLMDIDMPGTDPFDAVRQLSRDLPNARVIMLSAYIRDHFLDRAVDSGARGYFSKSDPPEAVMEGIRFVFRGEYAFGPSVLERLSSPEDGERSTDGSRLRLLTRREREILRMIGLGMSRAEIAKLLHRSLKTVDTHHTSIMKKLRIHDRAELAVYAVKEGLVV